MLDPWSSPHRIEPVRVLTVWLRDPVTLGQILLIEEMDSPLISGAALSLGELSLAVLVCSTTVRNARRFLRFRGARFVLGWWGRRCGRLDYAAEAQRFSEWFNAQVGGPTQKIRQAVAGPRTRAELAAPWHLHRMAVALGELGLSLAEAEAMPVRRLAQLCAALAEARGQAEFWTRQDEAFVEQCRRMDLARLQTTPAN